MYSNRSNAVAAEFPRCTLTATWNCSNHSSTALYKPYAPCQRNLNVWSFSKFKQFGTINSTANYHQNLMQLFKFWGNIGEVKLPHFYFNFTLTSQFKGTCSCHSLTPTLNWKYYLFWFGKKKSSSFLSLFNFKFIDSKNNLILLVYHFNTITLYCTVVGTSLKLEGSLNLGVILSFSSRNSKKVH